jgi:hypothetical protein
MTMRRPKPFVATCPDCDAHYDLEVMPAPGQSWPVCRDCWCQMNVYARPAAGALGEQAPVEE